MGETAVERKATKTYTNPKEAQVLQVVKVLTCGVLPSKNQLPRLPMYSSNAHTAADWTEQKRKWANLLSESKDVAKRKKDA